MRSAKPGLPDLRELPHLPDDSVPDAFAEIVPPAVRRLWAQPAPPSPTRRGPKPALNLDQITSTAIGLADAEGLAAVSMARVAQLLGYSSMALYRYIAGKDELLVLMADAMAPIPPSFAELPGWRRRLERWTLAQIEMVLQRPWYLELPLASTIPGPRRTMWLESAFAALAEVDVDTETKFRIIGLLAQHVLGEARVQLESQRAAAQIVRRMSGLPEDTPDADLDAEAMEAANPYASLGLVLGQLADQSRYPALFSALQSTSVGDSAGKPEEEAGPTLGIVLDGIEMLINRRLAVR